MRRARRAAKVQARSRKQIVRKLARAAPKYALHSGHLLAAGLSVEPGRHLTGPPSVAARRDRNRLGKSGRCVSSYAAVRPSLKRLRMSPMLINLSLIQLWLGVNGRGPMTAAGIYQAVARPGRQCGVTAYPHRFRHHFSHTWLDRGGAERDLMELNGWTSRRCSPATAPAPAAATTASWTTPPDPAAQDTTRQLSHSVSYSTVPIPLSRAPIISADGRIAAASQLCANAPVLRAQPPAPARLLDRHPVGPALDQPLGPPRTRPRPMTPN